MLLCRELLIAAFRPPTLSGKDHSQSTRLHTHMHSGLRAHCCMDLPAHSQAVDGAVLPAPAAAPTAFASRWTTDPTEATPGRHTHSHLSNCLQPHLPVSAGHHLPLRKPCAPERPVLFSPQFSPPHLPWHSAQTSMSLRSLLYLSPVILNEKWGKLRCLPTSSS